jgi:hypothetical protein
MAEFSISYDTAFSLGDQVNTVDENFAPIVLENAALQRFKGLGSQAPDHDKAFAIGELFQATDREAQKGLSLGAESTAVVNSEAAPDIMPEYVPIPQSVSGEKPGRILPDASVQKPNDDAALKTFKRPYWMPYICNISSPLLRLHQG